MGTPTNAQSSQIIQTDQTATVAYGSGITFAVRGTNPDPVMGARLHLQVLNRPEVQVVPQTFAQGQDFSAVANVPVDAVQLPPFAQITYFWELQTGAGIPGQSDSEQLLYEDTSVPWAWKVENDASIYVHWDGQDSTLGQSTLAATTAAAQRLADLTGARPQQAIHIYVYPELSLLAGSLRRHQERVQDWVAAYSIPDQGGILVAVSPGPDMFASLSRDITHELAHVFAYAAARQDPSKIPGWLNEGVALAVASDSDTSLDAELNKAVHDGVLLSINSLCAPNFADLPPRDAALAYAQSQSFVNYIIRRYGVSQIKGLFLAYAGGSPCAPGVMLVLGVPLSDLETQWHADLSRTIGGQIPQEMSLLPWFVAWCVSLTLAFLFISPQPSTQVKPSNLTQQSMPPVHNVRQN